MSEMNKNDRDNIITKGDKYTLVTKGIDMNSNTNPISERRLFISKVVHRYRLLRFLRSHKKSFKHAIIWIIMVILSGITPVVAKWSMRDENGIPVPNKFNISSANFLAFMINLLIGLSITYTMDGIRGIMAVMSPNRIISMAPVSLGYCVTEFLVITSISQLSVVTVSVIQKTNTIQATLMTSTILRRRISAQQWLSIIQLTILIVTAVLVIKKSPSSTEPEPTFYILLTVFAAFSSAASAIYGDWVYKRDPSNLAIQLASGRITASLGSLIIAIGLELFNTGSIQNLFRTQTGNWDYKIYGLILCLALRDIIVSFILKNLDAIWKMIGSGAAVGVSYVLSVMICKENYDIVRTGIVISIMINVIINAIHRSKVENRISETTQTSELQSDEESDICLTN